MHNLSLISGSNPLPFINHVSYAPLYGGHHFVAMFPNGYEASIVSHQFSYGGREGLWEIAIIKDDEIRYDTGITSEVLGFLTPDEVRGYLWKISEL
jgi:hypothetical protein